MGSIVFLILFFQFSTFDMDEKHFKKLVRGIRVRRWSEERQRENVGVQPSDSELLRAEV